MINKQKGMAEVSMITLLVLFVSFSLVVIKWESNRRIQKDAEKGAEVFKQVIAAAMSYRQDNGAFPSNIAQLVPVYLSNAAMTMPWGNAVTVAQSGGNNVVITTGAIDERIAGFMAADIPLATITGTTTVTATYGKPGTEPALDTLVHKDGTTPLTSEWDVGGYGLANVDDITITGLSNRTVLGGLTYSTIVSNAGVVNKLTCPSGSTTRTYVTPVAYSYNGQPFTDMGAVEARYNDLGSQIQAYVRVWGTLSGGGQNWIVPAANAAKVKVDMKCDK